MPDHSTFFALPDHLAAKRAGRLIDRDDRQFSAVAQALAEEAADVSARLALLRRSDGRAGQHALDRDIEIRRLASRSATIARYGVDLCLGRMVPSDGSEPVYIGRLGMSDRDGRRLLVDWRSEFAAPFFAATTSAPMGIASRRRYRWSRGLVVDYWDEGLTAAGTADDVALDDQSAFITSLATSRSARMRDVLGTIQADQDAILRADARGTLVVDGGPGTGKTVVALHRAAYLLYSDSRVSSHRGGVLVIGPNAAYLDFVADVLPDLGEQGVHLATLRDLDPSGATAPPEADPRVASLKGDALMLTAVERAVQRHELAPVSDLLVETEWADVVLTADDWSAAFDAPETGEPHDEARATVWRALVAILQHRAGADSDDAGFAADLASNDTLLRAFDSAWPVLDPEGLLAGLWSSPSLLQTCAPWLDESDIRLLQRDDARRWTTADLPLLDLARARIGDPGAMHRTRERAAAEAQERSAMARVIDELIDADDDDDGLMLMSMLRGRDAQNSLANASGLPDEQESDLGGPFAHIVVDEAQELTDAEWAMLVRRCPSRSFTVVGDRAQARRGFPEEWPERLARVGLRRARVAPLRINYRTPAEIMAVAAPEIRAVLADANVPTSIRSSGTAVLHGRADDLLAVLDEWLSAHVDGTVCVLTVDPAATSSRTPHRDRVLIAAPSAVKGLEFDLVVLLHPAEFGTGITGAVDRYVAMTRATAQLVVLS